jgi:hypothetical protein
MLLDPTTLPEPPDSIRIAPARGFVKEGKLMGRGKKIQKGNFVT